HLLTLNSDFLNGMSIAPLLEGMAPLQKTSLNPLITLRELFPLLLVILCLFGLLIYSVTVAESPKSKPIVRNEATLIKISER
ncbi:MAG: hypothetical protein ACKN9V_09690, partial [Pseudomonadota bacterium]